MNHMQNSVNLNLEQTKYKRKSERKTSEVYISRYPFIIMAYFINRFKI